MSTTNKSASEHSQELSVSELDQVAGGLFDLGPLSKATEAIDRVVQMTQTVTDGGGSVDPAGKLFQPVMQHFKNGEPY